MIFMENKQVVLYIFFRMKKQFTILHISDLHKPKNCNLNTLFYSLQTDCEAYTKDGISKPEIIVISGDIAEGSKNDGLKAKTIMTNIPLRQPRMIRSCQWQHVGICYTTCSDTIYF